MDSSRRISASASIPGNRRSIDGDPALFHDAVKYVTARSIGKRRNIRQKLNLFAISAARQRGLEFDRLPFRNGTGCQGVDVCGVNCISAAEWRDPSAALYRLSNSEAICEGSPRWSNYDPCFPLSIARVDPLAASTRKRSPTTSLSSRGFVFCWPDDPGAGNARKSSCRSSKWISAKPMPNSRRTCLTSRASKFHIDWRMPSCAIRWLRTASGFPKSEYAERWRRANLWNAMPIYELCPTALVFGMWGSPEKPYRACLAPGSGAASGSGRRGGIALKAELRAELAVEQ